MIDLSSYYYTILTAPRGEDVRDAVRDCLRLIAAASDPLPAGKPGEVLTVTEGRWASGHCCGNQGD